MTEKTFPEWLDQWRDEIEAMQLFTKSDLPTVAQEIQADLNRTTRDFPRVGELLADAENYVIVERAHETLNVKEDEPELSAAERKAIIESRIAHILRVRDILDTTRQALKQRSFALLNQRNFCREEMRMSGHAEG
jgi:hypothetical protein